MQIAAVKKNHTFWSQNKKKSKKKNKKKHQIVLTSSFFFFLLVYVNIRMTKGTALTDQKYSQAMLIGKVLWWTKSQVEMNDDMAFVHVYYD